VDNLRYVLKSIYLQMCDDNEVVPGTDAAEYLWKEYVADIATLELLEEVESLDESL